MPSFIKKRSEKSGLPPGTLIHIGEKKVGEVQVTLIDYDQKQLQEKRIKTIEEALAFKEQPTVTWINIGGLHEVDLIEKIGTFFNIHPLTQEDILNTEQRPKLEEFDDYLFIVLKMLYYDETEGEIQSEQISLILGTNYLITFQETERDVFDSVRGRIRTKKGRIRKCGCDYLAYTLVDAIIDNYFTILEIFEEKTELFEENLLSEPSPQTIKNIHGMKREMIFLRKQIWPVREILSQLGKGEIQLIHESVDLYFRDVYDHTIHVIDSIESLRDMLSGMLDVYLTTMSNKMNEVMKILTIIATIFIPLTFIAGVYGMNFKNMPELEWPWGYPTIWAIMIVIVFLMISYFKNKKWL